MINNFFENLILLLSTSEIVQNFSVKKRKFTATDGYIRIHVYIVNGDFLEVSLYCQISNMVLEMKDYRFHWQDKNERMIKRWDCCKHHPEIESFPHHMHLYIGEQEKTQHSKIVNLSDVLEEISNILKRD